MAVRRAGEDDADLGMDPAPTERRVRLAADNARLLQAEREARARAERAAERTARLQAVTASLAEALTRAQVADAVLREGLPAVGAFAGTISVAIGDHLEIVRREGYDERIEPRACADLVAIDERLPITDAFRTRAPVVISSPDEWLARYPDVAALVARIGTRAFFAAPLVLHARAVGALTLSFREARHFDDEDQAFLLALARQCAQALERARLYLEAHTARGVAERSERRQRFLSEASRALGSSLEIDSTLLAVARLAVSDFADACWFDLRGDDGAVRRIGDGGDVAPLDARAIDACTRARVVEEVDDDPSIAAQLPIGARSAAVLPLAARERPLGVMTLAYTTSSRRYRAEDVGFLEELARRVAVAIDNASLYQEAERLNRAKDEFLATLSHELRNPLNAMLGWTRLLRSGNLDEPTRERALETVERNVRAQAQLIEDLLDVSRIITGKMRLAIAPCDLRSVIDAAIDSLRPAADAREIALACAYDDAAGPILGDPDRLQQVVWNLLSNAIKFTPRGGRIDVTLAATVGGAEIRVHDTGRGIPAAFLPYVFDRFRQQDASTTRAHSGLGLGLSITRHLVELHGGTIHAESPGEGMGATFAVVLPHRTTRAEPPPSERARRDADATAAIDARALEGLRVLAVDDDPDARELLAAALVRHGAAATVVGSVRAAFDALARERFDLVVSDIGMPEEDGYALVRRLRALDDRAVARLPAVAVTAYAHADDRTRVLQAGFDAHVAKPIEPIALAALLRRVHQARAAAAT